MLATGIRTPVGIKILGPKLEEIEKIGLALEPLLREVTGTRSVYAERVNTGYFLDFVIKREEIARYGLAVDDIQEIIESAIGGMNLTTTIEGRERYPVNVRYARELRDDLEKLRRVLVPIMMENVPTRFGNFISFFWSRSSSPRRAGRYKGSKRANDD